MDICRIPILAYSATQEIQNAIGNVIKATSCHWMSKFVIVRIFHTSASGISKRSCLSWVPLVVGLVTRIHSTSTNGREREETSGYRSVTKSPG
jgi:hypothetical protein